MTQFDKHSETTGSIPSPLPKRPAVYVRLPEAEYLSLAKDALLLGKSVPETLRAGYFQGGGCVTVLMAKDAQASLMTALARIGNNVNQIARRLNGGYLHINSAEFRAMQEEFGKLNALVREVSIGSKKKRRL